MRFHAREDYKQLQKGVFAGLNLNSLSWSNCFVMKNRTVHSTQLRESLPVMRETAARFLLNAEEARARAARARTDVDQQQWLAMADNWMKLSGWLWKSSEETATAFHADE